MKTAAFAIAIATLVAPLPAAASRVDYPDTPTPSSPIERTRPAPWTLDLSLRTTFVNHPGMDAIGGSRALVQPGISGLREIWGRGKLALSVGFLGEIGTLGGSVRGGASTSVTSGRIEGVAEGRFHVVPWAYVFARIAPGAQMTHVGLSDASSSVGFSTTAWRPSLDASIGGALRLGGESPSWWLGTDFGWTWTPDMPMSLTADVARDDPRAFGTVDLGALAVRGLSWKLWLGVKF